MSASIVLLTLQLIAGIHSINWVHLSSRTGDIPTPNGGNQQTASLILDIDKNGTDDFVITDRSVTPSVVWYRRSASGWTKYVIDNTMLNIEAGGASYDIDGDGDLDIVFGGDYQSNQVWWWENPYPNFTTSTPWTRRLIKNGGSNKHHDEIFGDFNGDGKTELVFWNQDASTLYLATIPADPYNAATWSLTSIYTYSGTEHEGFAAIDVDNDGKLDIVGGGRWFKHTSGSTFAVEIIDDNMRFTRAAAGQLKRGGRPEVVFAPGDYDGPIKWYEWNGSSWTGTDLLGSNVVHGHSLQIADIDNNGTLDIFNAEMRLGGGNSNAKMRIFFGDGNGNFTLSEVATGFGNHESRLADLDGDGDLDILDKPYDWDAPRVDVWLQNGSATLPPYSLAAEHWQRHVIDQSKPWRAVFITAADMDNDGLKDVITGGWWYKNPGTALGTWTRNTIGAPLNNMACVYDFNNDGTMDVLGTKGQGADSNPEFVWGRNDGSGAFTILNNVATGDGDFLQGVVTTRFQSGTPLKVALSWHVSGKGIQTLTIPSDPSTDPWTWQQISTTSQDEQLSATDLERNGTIDLILGTKWLRNNGSWSSFDLNPTSGDPDRNRLADINRDGRIDVVVGFEAISIAGKLAWYEQPADPTGTWTEHIISTTVVGPMSVDVADMDHDGDIDVVVGEHNLNDPASARLLIFENLDGAGTSWFQHVVYTGDEHHDGAQLVDLDNDGDFDIISIGWDNPKVTWYENLSQSPLPVQLASFGATLQGSNRVQLHWTTLTETNNYGFHLQRSVGSGDQFSDRPNAFIPGHGTTLIPHNYSFVDTIETGGVHYYRLKQMDLDGTIHYSEAIQVNATTGVDDKHLPGEFSLKQNYPNPFNPTTSIAYTLAKETNVTIEVFDLVGRRVSTLLNNKQGAGSHTVTFVARDIGSGVYIYRMSTSEVSFTRKMLLMR